MSCRKSSCEKCGKNTTMSGSQICSICDPDIEAVIECRVALKSPHLCDGCYKTHCEEHKQLVEQ